MKCGSRIWGIKLIVLKQYIISIGSVIFRGESNKRSSMLLRRGIGSGSMKFVSKI